VEIDAGPEDAGVGFGGMHSIGFVDEAAAIFQTGEGVGEANWYVDDMVVLFTQLNTGTLAESRTFLPNIQNHIENPTRDAVDQLGMGMRRLLKVEAPHDVGCGGGEEFLLQFQRNTVLRELAFVEGLNKITPRIAVDERLQDFDAGEGF